MVSYTSKLVLRFSGYGGIEKLMKQIYNPSKCYFCYGSRPRSICKKILLNKEIKKNIYNKETGEIFRYIVYLGIIKIILIIFFILKQIIICIKWILCVLASKFYYISFLQKFMKSKNQIKTVVNMTYINLVYKSC